MWVVQVVYKKTNDSLYHFQERENAEQFMRNHMIDLLVSDFKLDLMEQYTDDEIIVRSARYREILNETPTIELHRCKIHDILSFLLEPVIVQDSIK